MVASASDEALSYLRPDEYAWTANDHLVHLLDAEASAFFRVKTAIAEPGNAVPLWDEEKWRAALRYDGQDGRRCLVLAVQLRAIVGELCASMVDRDWSSLYVVHPTKGRLDLAALLEVYRDHVAFHVPYIKRGIDAWKGSTAAKESAT